MSEIVKGLEGLLAGFHLDVALQPIVAFVIMMAVVFGLLGAAMWLAVRRRWIGRATAAFWLFVSPWIVGFLLFTGGPMVYSLVLSFTHWDLLSPARFAGLANYRQALHDPDVGQAVKVTLLYAVLSVPAQTVLSLAVALLMNVKVSGIHVFRTIWYLPSLVSGVAQTVLFIWVFNPEHGLVNGVLRLLGVEGPKWLFDPDWALPAVVIMRRARRACRPGTVLQVQRIGAAQLAEQGGVQTGHTPALVQSRGRRRAVTPERSTVSAGTSRQVA
ncbi:carbohydrate ABC transporter permease [Streptomyces canarius]